jgi:hypothetical protein
MHTKAPVVYALPVLLLYSVLSSLLNHSSHYCVRPFSRFYARVVSITVAGKGYSGIIALYDVLEVQIRVSAATSKSKFFRGGQVVPTLCPKQDKFLTPPWSELPCNCGSEFRVQLP